MDMSKRDRCTRKISCEEALSRKGLFSRLRRFPFLPCGGKNVSAVGGTETVRRIPAAPALQRFKTLADLHSCLLECASSDTTRRKDVPAGLEHYVEALRHIQQQQHAQESQEGAADPLQEADPSTISAVHNSSSECSTPTAAPHQQDHSAEAALQAKRLFSTQRLAVQRWLQDMHEAQQRARRAHSRVRSQAVDERAGAAPFCDPDYPEPSGEVLKHNLRSLRTVRTVAEGGFGVVKRVRDTKRRSGREYAAKFPRPEIAADEGYAKMVPEIKWEWDMTRAAGPHPNVLAVHSQVYDFDLLVGFTMELCDGSLLDVVSGTVKASAANRLQWYADTADALASVHERGIAHCDIKPANILRDGRRGVLADWGCAVELEETGRGCVRGWTEAYVPPEVLAAQRRAEFKSELWTSCAFDCFSFGVTVLEVELRQEVSPKDRKQAVRELARASFPLAQLVEGCLEPNPAKRWTMPRILDFLRAEQQRVALRCAGPTSLSSLLQKHQQQQAAAEDGSVQALPAVAPLLQAGKIMSLGAMQGADSPQKAPLAPIKLVATPAPATPEPKPLKADAPKEARRTPPTPQPAEPSTPLAPQTPQHSGERPRRWLAKKLGLLARVASGLKGSSRRASTASEGRRIPVQPTASPKPECELHPEGKKFHPAQAAALGHVQAHMERMARQGVLL